MNTTNPAGQTPANFFVSKETVHCTNKNEPFYEVFAVNCNGETIYDISVEQFRELYALMGKFITAADNGKEATND